VIAAAAPRAAGDADVFVGELRRAVARRDRTAVAAMAQYPMRVLAGGLPIPVSDRAALAKMYDLFFPPEMRCAIERGAVTESSEGLSIGGGTVWAQRTGAGIKITRMTVRGSSSGGPAKPRPTERVMFRAGQPATRLSGTLVRDDVQSYVVWAKKGQRLQAEITGFRGRDAIVRVLDQRGAPLDAKAQDEARTWARPIPVSADHRIDIVRRAPYCDPALTYDLIVTLR